MKRSIDTHRTNWERLLRFRSFGLALAVFLLGLSLMAQDAAEITVYHTAGKNRCHVKGCRRLTKDADELAKMTKMTLAEAEAKGVPRCSRCPGSTTAGKGNPEDGKKAEAKAKSGPDGNATVYHSTGKKRVHVKGCRRLTKDADELAKMTKMTMAEAKAKGLPPCSRCPGSTTAGAGNPKGGNGAQTKKPQNGGGDYGKYGRKGAKARKAWLEIPEKQYDPNTKAVCDALWMRVHEENCPALLLKDKKKVITLEQADKEGWRIGEAGQSGRFRCCFKGYRRKHPEKDIPEDAPGLVLTLKSGKLKWNLVGCHRFIPSSDNRRMTQKEAKAAGAFVCEHCIERGPSLTTISDEELKKMYSAKDAFVPPEGWVPKPYAVDTYPSKEEVEILLQQTLSGRNGVQEVQYENPVATAEQFVTMRFFFPVGKWLALHQIYRCTGDQRALDALLESARHYTKLSKEYPSAAQTKAKDPEGLAFMYSMVSYSRLTLQLARKHPDKVSQKQLGEAEEFLKTIVSVLKPTCEGDDNLDPKMGIPKPLADDFRGRAFNRAANGIGTIAMATAALEDLQAVKKTTTYKPTIDRYRKCVKEWVKNWKSVGCLYTEEDGKKYFYYPYGAGDKGKVVDGFKLFGSEDQGHFTHCLQGVYLMYEAMPECGTDDDFMTAIANAVYHNSGTKNGSIQCPSADKKRPMSRKPFGAPRDRFYLLQAFHDGIIDGQCSKLSKAKKEAVLSGHGHRLKTLHAQYLKALRKDRTLIYLGESK